MKSFKSFIKQRLADTSIHNDTLSEMMTKFKHPSSLTHMGYLDGRKGNPPSEDLSSEAKYKAAYELGVRHAKAFKDKTGKSL